MDERLSTAQPQTTWTFGIPAAVEAAFRFHALLNAPTAAAQDSPPLTFSPAWHDIDTLDHQAHASELPITVLSVPAYAYVQDRYRLLSCGARFGSGYGAMVVAYNPLTPAELPNGISIGVPGLRNSGFLALSLLLPQTFQPALLPASQLREAVVRGEVQAALLTGEDQLTHQALGLYNVVDLGAWWQEQTGLPFPLEVVAVRRDVPEEIQRQIARMVRNSVQEALTNRGPALDFAMAHARKMDRESTDTYIGMYVDNRSVEMDSEGRRSLQTLLERGTQRQLLPAVTHLDILDAI